jgi:hypothetical protein
MWRECAVSSRADKCSGKCGCLHGLIYARVWLIERTGLRARRLATCFGGDRLGMARFWRGSGDRWRRPARVPVKSEACSRAAQRLSAATAGTMALDTDAHCIATGTGTHTCSTEGACSVLARLDAPTSVRCGCYYSSDIKQHASGVASQPWILCRRWQETSQTGQAPPIIGHCPSLFVCRDVRVARGGGRARSYQPRQPPVSNGLGLCPVNGPVNSVLVPDMYKLPTMPPACGPLLQASSLQPHCTALQLLCTALHCSALLCSVLPCSAHRNCSLRWPLFP